MTCYKEFIYTWSHVKMMIVIYMYVKLTILENAFSSTNFIFVRTLGAELEKIKWGEGKANGGTGHCLGRRLQGHLDGMTSARAPHAWANLLSLSGSKIWPASMSRRASTSEGGGRLKVTSAPRLWCIPHRPVQTDSRRHSCWMDMTEAPGASGQHSLNL